MGSGRRERTTNGRVSRREVGEGEEERGDNVQGGERRPDRIKKRGKKTQKDRLISFEMKKKKRWVNAVAKE